MPNSGMDLSSTVSYAGQDASMINGFLQGLQEISAANTARSEELAERAWQRELEAQARVMDYNALEAAKNRDWQEMMSSTAHQREVQDLIAAGLNPVLSATGGNGASVTSGAAASTGNINSPKGDVDTSVNSALVSVLSSALNRQTQLEMLNIEARNNEKIAEMYTEATKTAAMISGNYNVAAMQQSGYNQLAAQGQMYGFNEALANLGYEHSSALSQQNYRQSSSLSAQKSRQTMQEKKVQQQLDIGKTSAQPSSMWNVLGDIVRGYTGKNLVDNLKDSIGNYISNYQGQTMDGFGRIWSNKSSAGKSSAGKSSAGKSGKF